LKGLIDCLGNEVCMVCAADVPGVLILTCQRPGGRGLAFPTLDPRRADVLAQKLMDWARIASKIAGVVHDSDEARREG
jgi:hypothetical protein